MLTKELECKTQKSTHVANRCLVLHKVAQNHVIIEIFSLANGTAKFGSLGKLDIHIHTNKNQVRVSVPEQK